MSFAIGAVFLGLTAMLFVLAPFAFRARAVHQDQRQAVIAIAKARLDELARDYAADIFDEATYRQLKLEQERRLLQEAEQGIVAAGKRSRVLLMVAALSIPLGAGVFYFYFGAWDDWHIQTLLERSERQIAADADNRATLEELAAALKHRIERRADADGRRRFMLARIDTEFGRYQAALVQYAALQKKFPDDPSIAAQYAQVLYLAADRHLTDEASMQAQRALKADPNQTTALGLLGIDAFEHKDYATALLHWRHLLQQLPPGSANAGLIERGIKQAEQKLGPEGFPGPKIVVAVSLAPELKEALIPGATLFVFARAIGGPPMPLAVARLDPQQLPLTVTLDDSMAMAPGVNLSSAKQIEVVARISASGQVRAASGDLEGGSPPLSLENNATQQLQLQINHQR